MQESLLSENEINLLALLNYLEKKNLPPFNREKILDKQETQKIQQKLILLGFSFNMIESVMYYDLDYANNIKDGLNLKNDK
jgi:SOS response regulatory protein OraA/RecX